MHNFTNKNYSIQIIHKLMSEMMATQYQKQAQMTRDQQIVAEIQYTVQKDLDNFMGIMMESIAVTEMVNRDDPLFLIHINRLIAQLNLSQTIYFDTQLNCQHNGSERILKEQKSLSLKMLQEFVQSSQIKPVSEIEQLLNDYANILQRPQTTSNIKNLFKTNPRGIGKEQQFKIENLLKAMSQIDDDYARIRNGQQVQLGDKQQLFEKVNNRYYQAQKKIQIYLNLQNNDNNHLQNSQIYGNSIPLNNNINQNQINNNGTGNGSGNSNGNRGSAIGTRRSNGIERNINANPINQELYQSLQPGLEQSQNISQSNFFQQNSNNPQPQVNENQKKMEQEQLNLKDDNKYQLTQYSPETQHIIKSIILIMYHPQPQYLDIRKMFDFIYSFQESIRYQVFQELVQLQQKFHPKGYVEYIINRIQVCINTNQALNFQTNYFQNIQRKDEQILNQLIREDFK
ncbi:hypothetical protein pb186bvf_016041 [Paramecium bursaria]